MQQVEQPQALAQDALSLTQQLTEAMQAAAPTSSTDAQALADPQAQARPQPVAPMTLPTALQSLLPLLTAQMGLPPLSLLSSALGIRLPGLAGLGGAGAVDAPSATGVPPAAAGGRASGARGAGAGLGTGVDAEQGGSEEGSRGGRDDAEHGGAAHGFGAGYSRLQISKPQLQQLYHLPRDKAAKQLGISVQSLKRCCRDLAIKRWPHRKLQSIEALIKSVEEAGGDPEGAASVVNELQRFKEEIYANPEVDYDDRIKKMRQTFFKARYAQRLRASGGRRRVKRRMNNGAAGGGDDSGEEEGEEEAEGEEVAEGQPPQQLLMQQPQPPVAAEDAAAAAAAASVAAAPASFPAPVLPLGMPGFGLDAGALHVLLMACEGMERIEGASGLGLAMGSAVVDERVKPVDGAGGNAAAGAGAGASGEVMKE